MPDWPGFPGLPESQTPTGPYASQLGEAVAVEGTQQSIGTLAPTDSSIGKKSEQESGKKRGPKNPGGRPPKAPKSSTVCVDLEAANRDYTYEEVQHLIDLRCCLPQCMHDNLKSL